MCSSPFYENVEKLYKRLPEMHEIMAKIPSQNQFQSKVMKLLQTARSQVVRQVNPTMVHTYYEIGKMIVRRRTARPGQGRIWGTPGLWIICLSKPGIWERIFCYKFTANAHLLSGLPKNSRQRLLNSD